MSSVANEGLQYACRKCRHRLFSEANIEKHEPGNGQQDFQYHKRGGRPEITCSVYFVGQMDWMGLGGEEQSTEGKLSCPKCSARVGSYTWFGDQCSCGYWCTPSFQIPKSRVDEVEQQPIANIRYVSVPRKVDPVIPPAP
eukprot:TRINITY_DN9012_c1_g1_i3.p1 TRINITY_DN9012_c1_g1~~TRINITY_DN9012_c1_g1_i3.p1  ORF type:complete len:140 (-),score=13.39 TRINITY_DN9012_c1_g1_i3:41-460(-)